MKSTVSTLGLLFGIISQTSAAIVRLAEPSASLKGAFHGALGDSSSPVIWSSSLTEMQERIAEGQRLASLPPPKTLDAKSPPAAKDETSFLEPKASLGPSKSRFHPAQAPVSNGQQLNVDSEQYKIMKLAHGRFLKGGGRGGGLFKSHGGGAAAAAGSHNAAANAPFSTKLTWVFLAGNLALLRRMFNFARI